MLIVVTIGDDDHDVIGGGTSVGGKFSSSSGDTATNASGSLGLVQVADLLEKIGLVGVKRDGKFGRPGELGDSSEHIIGSYGESVEEVVDESSGLNPFLAVDGTRLIENEHDVEFNFARRSLALVGPDSVGAEVGSVVSHDGVISDLTSIEVG